MAFLVINKDGYEYEDLGERLSIYKTRNSKNWYIYLWHEGERIQKSLRISNKEDAIDEAKFLRKALDRDITGGIIEKPKKLAKSITSKLISQLEKDREEIRKRVASGAEKKSLSKHNQYKEKGRLISIYIDFANVLGTIKVAEIDYAHLTVFYNKFDLKTNTTQLRYMNMALKRFFEFCLTVRLIKSIPPFPKIRTKTKETNKYFTQTDYETLLSGIRNSSFRKQVETENNELLYRSLIFLTETGVRPGNELTGLRYCDLGVEIINDTKYWVLQVVAGKRAEKDGYKRKIIINTMAVDCLKALTNRFDETISVANNGYFLSYLKRNKDRHFFARKDKKIPDYTQLFGNARDKVLDELLEKNLVPYSCRHTFITNQLKRGANENIVAQHCGTSTGMITKHYNHLLSMMKPDELLDEVAIIGNIEEQVLLPDDKGQMRIEEAFKSLYIKKTEAGQALPAYDVWLEMQQQFAREAEFKNDWPDNFDASFFEKI